MTKKDLIAHIHSELKPLGFKRKASTWNRVSGDFIDIINIQSASSSSDFAVNLSVVYKNAFEACLLRTFEPFIDETCGTMRARLGQIAYQKDVWWKLENPGMASEIIGLILEKGIPFLSQLHSIDAMELALETKMAKWTFPFLPEGLYLALLKAQKGDTCAALALLERLQSAHLDEWSKKINSVKKWIEQYR